MSGSGRRPAVAAAALCLSACGVLVLQVGPERPPSPFPALFHSPLLPCRAPARTLTTNECALHAP
jgi:hypothetical protein